MTLDHYAGMAGRGIVMHGGADAAGQPWRGAP